MSAAEDRERGPRLRARTQAHYDRYPFRFDQRAIIQEKLENRVMGRAIQALHGNGSRVLDVGSGERCARPPATTRGPSSTPTPRASRCAAAAPTS